MHDVIAGRTAGTDTRTEPEPLPDYHQPIIAVRLANYTPYTSLRRLKASLIGKFVSLRGTVVRVGNFKQLVSQMVFVCNRCSTGQVVHFVDGTR